ncbi:hypothetical protein [Dyadobacter crusticola]|uniref:hypothetical protein n=1 Tax=Dyadobacter crusticola TaxID=292407 RepID=UPI0004E10368|nr:hypothetical protein [Dyadobacter crusticola]
MKPSNILITCLLVLILLVTVGANFVLKAEYDKIDKTDPLAGYRNEALPAFKYIILEGLAFGVTQIRPAKNHELRTIADPKYLTWKMSADTIVFTYHRDWAKENMPTEYALRAIPSFYITAPNLAGIESRDVICKVTDWKSDHLVINQTDGAILFSANKIEHLQLDLKGAGLTKIDSTNEIGKAGAQVKQSSTFNIEKNVIKSLEMKLDSSAHISLPGSLINKSAL